MLTTAQYKVLKAWPDCRLPRVEHTPAGGLAVFTPLGTRVGALSTFNALARKGLVAWVKGPKECAPRPMVFVKIQPACDAAIREYEEAQSKTKTHKGGDNGIEN